MKTILLTFDTEEFDLPLEYGINISEEQQFETTKKGLEDILNLLKKYNLHATFFTTARFARKFPSLIKDISQEHEIACHGYEHSDSYIKDISKIQIANEQIEKIIKKPVHGFRAPRFQIKNLSGLSKFGFSYDSSINPTFIPGRYMNLLKKRKIHKIGEIIEVPLSVLPLVRFPLFWLSFKILPLNCAKIFTKINFTSNNYTMHVFHPWEFADLSNFNIPKYIKNPDSDELLNKLEDYIEFCKRKGYEFETVGDFLQKSLRCPNTAFTPRRFNIKSSKFLMFKNLIKTYFGVRKIV